MSAQPDQEPRHPDDRALRAERQLAATQQITHIGSWEWDLATGALSWSDELYRIYGLEPGSTPVSFDLFLSRLHPEDAAKIRGNVERAIAEGGRFGYEERIVRPDGAVRILDTAGEVVKSEDGRPLRLIGTCRDVTEERRISEQLRLFADIVHHVQIGLSVWDVPDPDDPRTMVLRAYNPASERIARIPLAPELGRSLLEIVPYVEGGRMPRLLAEVRRDGQVREEIVPRSRDPRNPNRALSIKAFRLPGNAVGVALEDITDRVMAERLRAAEQQLLERIAEGAPLGTVLTQLAGALEEHTPAALFAVQVVEEGTEKRRCFGPSLPPDCVEALVQGPPASAAKAALEHAIALTDVVPIVAKDGRELGALVRFERHGVAPGPRETEVLARAAYLARIAIERQELLDQLRELSAHVESIREDERTGIAREIHDELGQALTALKMDVAWILRRASSESMTFTYAALVEKLTSMSKMVDETIQQVRRISGELRPGVLDHLGLVAAIEWQAQQFESRTGTECLVRTDDDLTSLDRQTATAVFRIFQEALTNVARHAEAKRVDVEIEVKDGWLFLEVKDDGKGIPADAAKSGKSLGLLGLRERARRLGGDARIAALGEGPRPGTAVTLRLPVSCGAAR